MFDLQAAREILAKVDTPLNLLEGLFFHSPIGVQLYNAEGRSLFVNEAFYKIFGAVPPPGYCVLRDEVAARTGAASIIREAFNGKFTKLPVTWYDARELEHVKVAEARRCAIETFLVPIFGEAGAVKYVVFLMRDVTHEQELEQEKQETNRKLEEANLLIKRLMNGTRAVIYAKDLDGRLLFVNDAYGRVAGRDPEWLIGKLVEEVHSPEEAALFRVNDLLAMDGRELLEAEETVRFPDGSVHEYISQKFPLRDGAGKVYGVCGVSTDITDVRRLEKELGQARRMESLGVLAGGVAHDFNNLLGMILLNTEAVAARLPKEGDLARDLEQIRFSVERASSLVRQLLAFGRRLPMASRPVDLNLVVRNLTYMIEKLAGEGTRLEVELAPSNCVARADPSRVEQVLLNLCMNARDAIGRSGRIRVSTGLETIEPGRGGLSLECPAGQYVFLEVEDDGHGMSAEVLERAFDPFFTTKDRAKGSGLGLSTVFGIMQESDGGLSVRTSPGQGCVVRLYFPCSESLPAGAVSDEGREPARPASPVTILLVEDEPLLRQITAKQLQFEGFKVLEAGNSPEAIDLLKRHPEVAVVVTDVIMPGQSGPSMVKQLRDDGLLKGKGVMFITGYSSEELAGKGFSPESMHLLEKPFTTRGLVEMIAKAVRDPVR